MNEVAQRRFPFLFVVGGALLLLVLGGLAVSRLGSSGDGGPRAALQASVSFPPTVEPDAIETAEVTVTNIGDVDVESLYVSFSLVGAGGAAGVPTPLVEGTEGDGASVIAIRPEPSARGGGIRFGFGPLAAGEATTVSFDLRVPDVRGTAANSVQVYDGVNPSVAAGARLETEVE